MAKQSHEVLWLAGVGAAGLAGYEFVYKPWAAAKAAGTALPPVSSFLTSPNTIPPPPTLTNNGGVQGSIVDPRNSPGGLVGYAMWKKNWTQDYARQRLQAYIDGYKNAESAIATLKANTGNPAAAGIPAAQAQLAVYDATITAQKAALAQQAPGSSGYNQFATSISALQADRDQLAARIAAAGQATDNSAAIGQYQAAQTAADADFFALTNTHLAGVTGL